MQQMSTLNFDIHPHVSVNEGSGGGQNPDSTRGFPAFSQFLQSIMCGSQGVTGRDTLWKESFRTRPGRICLGLQKGASCYIKSVSFLPPYLLLSLCDRMRTLTSLFGASLKQVEVHVKKKKALTATDMQGIDERTFNNLNSIQQLWTCTLSHAQTPHTHNTVWMCWPPTERNFLFFFSVPFNLESSARGLAWYRVLYIHIHL